MASGDVTSEVIASREVVNADELHGFLNDVLVEQAFGKVGAMYVEHRDCGMLVKAILLKTTLTDGSEVHDIKLVFESDE